MHRIYPKQIILPIILIFTFIFLMAAQTVYGFTTRNVEANAISQASTSKKPIISTSYPASIQQWRSEISRAADANSLDPNLLAAVMLQESGGQPEVISASGAVGLLQIMPRDGIAAAFTCVNGPCFQGRPSIEELKDPAFNIQYGAKMLSGLIQREGSLRSALFAYGPIDVGFSYADRVIDIYHTY